MQQKEGEEEQQIKVDSYRYLQVLVRVVQIALQIYVFLTQYSDLIYYQIVVTNPPWAFLLCLVLWLPFRIFSTKPFTLKDLLQTFIADTLHWFPQTKSPFPKIYYLVCTAKTVALNIYVRHEIFSNAMMSNTIMLLQLVNVMDMVLLSHNHDFPVQERLDIKFDVSQFINESILWNLFGFSNIVPNCHEDSTVIQVICLAAASLVTYQEWQYKSKTDDFRLNNKLFSFILSVVVAVLLLATAIFLAFFVPPLFFIYFERLTTKQQQTTELQEKPNKQHVYMVVFIVVNFLYLWILKSQFAHLDIGYEMIIIQLIAVGKFMYDIMKWEQHFIKYGSHFPEVKISRDFVTKYNPEEPRFQVLNNQPYLIKTLVKMQCPILNETEQNLKRIMLAILNLKGYRQVDLNTHLSPGRSDEFFEYFEINPWKKTIFLLVDRTDKFGLIVIPQLNQSIFYDYEITMRVKDQFIQRISLELAVNYELLPRLTLRHQKNYKVETYEKDFFSYKFFTMKFIVFNNYFSEFMTFDSRQICLDLYFD